MAGWLQATIILGIVVALHVPLGNYFARVFTSTKHSRAERFLYRVCGVNPDSEQTWQRYLLALLAFSAVSIVALFTLFNLQHVLPLARDMVGLNTPLALHTAISFTTNTSWQNYAGESTMGHLGVMAGLGVQAFGSAAVGIAVGLALVRGLVRHSTTELGNFWVDLIRAIFRVLPLGLGHLRIVDDRRGRIAERHRRNLDQVRAQPSAAARAAGTSNASRTGALFVRFAAVPMAGVRRAELCQPEHVWLHGRRTGRGRPSDEPR